MNGRIVVYAAAASLMASLAAAQSSGSRSANAGRDPLVVATSPMTPKSAMASPHKSAAAIKVPAQKDSAAAELTRLEGQKAVASRPVHTPPVKALSAKSNNDSRGGPGINVPYRKPQVTRKN
jgi:hypothetical protein